jgi:hypothetical protein
MKRFSLIAKFSVAVLFLFISVIPAGHVSSATAQTIGCTAPEHRQFDFWLGDWDVFEVDGGAKVARTHVDSILNGCVLQETYGDSTGYKGESFTIYDASRKVWHQTWVTNRGKLLVIEGTLRSGEITLTGTDRQDGAERTVRGLWKPAEGGVRETAVISTDGGATWKPWFDLMFRPHKP